MPLPWSITTRFPYPPLQPATMTVPDAAAAIGVPLPPEMSIPSCILPQRGPKPEVIGPLTGQTRPADEGGPTAAAPPEDGDRPCAARIVAASFADRAWRPRAST